MSKLVQVYLSKRLTVNFGRDDQGEAKTIVLEEGFQEVEQEVAEHWFVKAHLKEFTSNDSSSHALQNELDAANAAIESLTTQSEAATAKINQLTDDLKNRDKDVADLKIQLAKAQQTQSEAAKPTDSPTDAETKTKGK
ncbi:STY1053 family phage-associated protein [Acinetobacter guillouiae]|uniref:STY1053 family phage-associated protein n=1 Tax=Acinetobacter guillouiae TaxID=106649 RepID=UPI003C6FD059